MFDFEQCSNLNDAHCQLKTDLFEKPFGTCKHVICSQDEQIGLNE